MRSAISRQHREVFLCFLILALFSFGCGGPKEENPIIQPSGETFATGNNHTVYLVHGLLGHSSDTFGELGTGLERMFLGKIRVVPVSYDTDSANKRIKREAKPLDFAYQIHSQIIDDFVSNNLPLNTPFSFIVHSQGGIVATKLVLHCIVAPKDNPDPCSYDKGLFYKGLPYDQTARLRAQSGAQKQARRDFFETNGTPQNVRNLITLGSPFWGSPGANKLDDWKFIAKIIGMPAGQVAGLSVGSHSLSNMRNAVSEIVAEKLEAHVPNILLIGSEGSEQQAIRRTLERAWEHTAVGDQFDSTVFDTSEHDDSDFAASNQTEMAIELLRTDGMLTEAEANNSRAPLDLVIMREPESTPADIEQVAQAIRDFGLADKTTVIVAGSAATNPYETQLSGIQTRYIQIPSKRDDLVEKIETNVRRYIREFTAARQLAMETAERAEDKPFRYNREGDEITFRMPFPRDLRVFNLAGDISARAQELGGIKGFALRRYRSRPTEYDIIVDTPSARLDFHTFFELGWTELEPFRQSLFVAEHFIVGDYLHVDSSFIPGLAAMRLSDGAPRNAYNHPSVAYVEEIIKQSLSIEAGESPSYQANFDRPMVKSSLANEVDNFMGEIQVVRHDEWDEPLYFDDTHIDIIPMKELSDGTFVETTLDDPAQPFNELQVDDKLTAIYSGLNSTAYDVDSDVRFQTFYHFGFFEEGRGLNLSTAASLIPNINLYPKASQILYRINIPGHEPEEFTLKVSPGMSSFARIFVKPLLPIPGQPKIPVLPDDFKSGRFFKDANGAINRLLVGAYKHDNEDYVVTLYYDVRVVDNDPNDDIPARLSVISSLKEGTAAPETFTRPTAMGSESINNQDLIDNFELDDTCFVGEIPHLPRTDETNGRKKRKVPVYPSFSSRTPFYEIRSGDEVFVVGRYSGRIDAKTEEGEPALSSRGDRYLVVSKRIRSEARSHFRRQRSGATPPALGWIETDQLLIVDRKAGSCGFEGK